MQQDTPNGDAVRSILMVEDDLVEAELVTDLLASTCYRDAELHHCQRLSAGIELLATKDIDVVLLDLNLPDGNGIENLAAVRANNRDVAVIILTNIEEDDSSLHFVAMGAQDYLVKRRVTADSLARSIRYAVARQHAEVRVRESERRFELAVSGARDGIWDWDLVDDSIYYSPRWFQMVGIESGANHPSTWLERIHPSDQPGLHKALQAHLDGHTPYLEYEFRMSRGKHEEFWALARGLAVRDDAGKAIRIAGSLTDVSDRKATEAMLVHEAMHDALTGLPNRSLFLDRLDLAIRRYRRDRSHRFAVLFLDLDRFKAINDGLGHAVGDELLREIGRRLAKFVRPGDSVARLGGDEFAILLHDVKGLADATLVAERVHELLNQKFVIGDREVVTSASIGIALSDIAYERSTDLLRDADLAMYRTKRTRAGSYAVFDQFMHETVLERLELETQLRTALGRNELTLYYQPIVSLEHMRVTGFEALLRWLHPTRGLLGPEEFVPLAEESGSITALTWWAMRQACRQTRIWQALDPTLGNLSISVNVSTRLFSEPDFAARTASILEQTGLAPNALHLELTENAVLEHEETTLRELNALRELGVKLHLDDFGTGYSSLSYLNLFAYDTIKIDRSFVAAADGQSRDRQLVDALVQLGRILEMNVIAEGVETQEQAHRLRELKCGAAQGFWFSRPLPSESVEPLLQREQDLSRSSIRNLTHH